MVQMLRIGCTFIFVWDEIHAFFNKIHRCIEIIGCTEVENWTSDSLKIRLTRDGVCKQSQVTVHSTS